MGDITTIGLDLAKSVFQIHAVDEVGSVMMRKRLRRSQVLDSLLGFRRASSASKLARRRTIGPAS